MKMSMAPEMTLEQKIERLISMVETFAEKLEVISQVVISRVDILTRVQDQLDAKVLELDNNVTLAIEALKSIGLTMPMLNKTHELLEKLYKQVDEKRKKGVR